LIGNCLSLTQLMQTKWQPGNAFAGQLPGYLRLKKRVAVRQFCRSLLARSPNQDDLSWSS